MGHSRIETTANVYAQEVTEDARDLMASYYQDIAKPNQFRGGCNKAL